MDWKTLYTDGSESGWTGSRFICNARLVLAGAVCIATIAASDKTDLAFRLFIPLAFLCVIPFSAWLSRDHESRGGAIPFVVLDAFIATGIVHFSGGIASQMCLLYALVILTAGIVISARMALHAASLAIASYATVVFLEAEGFLIYRGFGVSPYDTANAVARGLMARGALFALIAVGTEHLARKCVHQNAQVERLQRMVRLIIDNVSVAIFAVSESGRLLLANREAIALLGLDPGRPGRHCFQEFFVDSPPRLDETVDADRVWAMRKANGSTFYGTYESSIGPIPAMRREQNGVEPGENSYVVAVRDITQQQELHGRARERARLRTAVNVAQEVAQWIRNPVTAIRVSGDFISSMIGRGSGREVKLTAQELGLLSSMCRIISDETQRLSHTVEDFLSSATEDDHEKLRGMIAEAESWNRRQRLEPAYGEAHA